jgi:ribonucleoside-diphosphate reductase alpha chain
MLHDHRGLLGWDGAYTQEQGYLIGLLVGDGTLKADKAVLSVWAPEIKLVANGGTDMAARHSASGIMQAALDAAQTLKHRADFAGWQRPVAGRGEFRLASAALRDLAFELGMAPGRKTLTPEVEQGSSAFCVGVLRGLFDADGSVQGAQDKGVSVRLTQADVSLLQTVQRMLLRMGIVATIYTDRRAGGPRLMPDGQGGQREYGCRALHELVISGDNLAQWADLVGFADTDKAQRLAVALQGYRRSLNRERFTATVAALTPCGEQDVYDVTVADVHAFDANGLVVHNCAEQPLPPYGCCCLGSIDLTRFVCDPFEPSARFDEAAFAKVAQVAVRMLDNVLDTTVWPLPQQQEEARRKRRIGLGFTGLGDALVMLGLRYDETPAREKAARISEVLRDAAYEASADLAKERGAFKLFNADLLLSGNAFASRLPQPLREKIRTQGLRNSHLLSIAPTGTISLAFADNASNGIEPAFSWSYTRKKRQADGSLKEYAVEDHAWRLYRHLKGIDAPLTQAFVTALEMSAQSHAAMVGAVAPYVDSAISKTVNVPADYPYEDFQGLYLQAWRAGLKGLATYRPNSVLGSVLSVTPEPTEPLRIADANRRLALERLPAPVLASLRWPSRPELPGGNAAWTFMVRHLFGDFALFVGEEGNPPRPFEVWVNGNEQPRGLGALAKSLSMDLRSNDAAWLRLKLDVLSTVAEERPFEMPFPPSGQARPFPGVVAAMAAVLRWRCEQLGALLARWRDARDRRHVQPRRAAHQHQRHAGLGGGRGQPGHRRSLHADAQGSDPAHARRRHRDQALRGGLLGQLSQGAGWPGARAEPGHARHRPGLDRHEAAQAAQLRRAAGPLHGLRAGRKAPADLAQHRGLCGAADHPPLRDAGRAGRHRPAAAPDGRAGNTRPALGNAADGRQALPGMRQRHRDPQGWVRLLHQLWLRGAVRVGCACSHELKAVCGVT